MVEDLWLLVGVPLVMMGVPTILRLRAGESWAWRPLLEAVITMVLLSCVVGVYAIPVALVLWAMRIEWYGRKASTEGR